VIVRAESPPTSFAAERSQPVVGAEKTVAPATVAPRSIRRIARLILLNMSDSPSSLTPLASGFSFPAVHCGLQEGKQQTPAALTPVRAHTRTEIRWREWWQVTRFVNPDE